MMKEGYLLKRSDNLKRWRNRWFWLDNRKGRLLYKETQEDRIPKGVFALVNAFVGPLPSPAKHPDYFCFYVRSSFISIILAAESADAANRWMECIAVAAASATNKAAVWRQGSLLPIGPPSRSGSIRHQTPSHTNLAQSMLATQGPVDPSLVSARTPPVSSIESNSISASTPGSDKEAAPLTTEIIAGPPLERPAVTVTPLEAPSRVSKEQIETTTYETPTVVRKLDVDTTPCDSGSQADLNEDTPFQTPLSSGEPSPSTPPGLTLDPVSREVLRNCSTGKNSHQDHAPVEEGILLPHAGEPLSNESRTATWTAHADASDEVLFRTVQSDEPDATPSFSHPSSGFGAFHDAGLGGSMLAHDASGESDAGTADSDSFHIQPKHASSGSSTDYTRHLGPPFGWPTVTPRCASQYPTPRSRPKIYLYNPRKQGAKAGPVAALPASSHAGDLTKFSKGQLISMLQMARDAVAAKEEQLSLMQSVAQIDARELAKAMAQAEECAAQAQAELARHREQARKEQEERLARAELVSTKETQRLECEVDGLKKELEQERASNECLRSDLQQMEAELVKHAQIAASATARWKALRDQEARCNELEARLSSHNNRVQGTESALLKPFW